MSAGPLKIIFSEHYYNDPATNLDEITVVDYIMTSKKQMVKKNLFKIERKTRKRKTIYILFRYYPKKNMIKIINAKMKGGK